MLKLAAEGDDLGRTTWQNFAVIKGEHKGKKLNWQILELLASAENEKHDAGSVHATPWEKLLRVIRIAPTFKGARAKFRLDEMLAFLVTLYTCSDDVSTY